MKKLLLLFLGVVSAQLAMSQTIVVLNLPDPCLGFGVEEPVSTDSNFEVFPNPADDAVTLSFSSVDPIDEIEVQVADLTGTVVIREQFKSTGVELRAEMTLGNLAPGIYTISVRGKDVYSVKKLIIK